MAKLKQFIFFLILFISSNTVFANFIFNKNCINAYQNIINLNFAEAKRMLIAEKTTNPQNDIPYLLENYIDFFTLVIDDDKNQFKNLEKNKDLRLERIDKGDKSSPYYLYSKAQINLQWAFARAKNEEYLTTALEIRKAYNLIEENDKKFPKFTPNKMVLGMIHVIIGSIPDNFKFVSSITGYKGSVKQGISEVENVYKIVSSNSEYYYLKDETIYLLSFMLMGDINENDDNTKSIYEIIKKNCKSESPMVTFAISTLAIQKGDNDLAFEILNNRKANQNTYPFLFLEYLQGQTSLNKLSIDAIPHYETYISKLKGKTFLKTSYQKIAWCYLVNGNKAKYTENIFKIKTIGNLESEEDNNAQKEAIDGQIPNVYLLKARLLFNGGYYKKALEVISEKKPSEAYNTKNDMIEFAYRSGRIYHKLNNYEKAISYYKLTINLGIETPLYFAANAALQAGLIYEKQKDFSNAKVYFEKCLSLNKYEYKWSIEQEAKAGLKRVNN